MAIQIPDSPNVIGSQPVLRQPDVIAPGREIPNFKVDITEPANAIKDMGHAYANYLDHKTDIYMGAVCEQFSHDMISYETNLKATHKNLAANDLYSKLEKKARELVADTVGAPKNDKRIRIANRNLQNKFKDWANRQMPTYQSRMMNYTAQQLDNANSEIIKQGIETTNNFVMGASQETAAEELRSAYESYQRAARLSAPGMPASYQKAEAARLLDASVYAKMKSLSNNNVLDAVSWYRTVPSVSNSLSSASQSKLFADMQDDIQKQGAAFVAESFAQGGSGADGNKYIDTSVLQFVYQTNDPSRISTVRDKILIEGRKINDARQQAVQGIKEQQLASVSGKIETVDINNPQQVLEVYQEYRNIDDKAAEAWFKGVQNEQYFRFVSNRFQETFPMIDPNDVVWTEEKTREAAAGWEKELKDFTNKKMSEKPDFSGGLGALSDISAMMISGKKPSITIEDEFEKVYGTKEEYIQKRKEEFLTNAGVPEISVSDEEIADGLQELKDMYAAKYAADKAAGIKSKNLAEEVDANPERFRENVRNNIANRKLQEAQEVYSEFAKQMQERANWLNDPKYAEYYMKAAEGQWHGEWTPSLEGLPPELENNLRQVAHTVDKYNEITRQNPGLDSDVMSKIPDKKKAKPLYIKNIKTEVVKAMDRYRTHLGSYPARNSKEYENMIDEVIKFAESPSEARLNVRLSDNAYDLIEKSKINAYLNPAETQNLLKENKILLQKLAVSRKIKRGTDAEDLADEIIDTTPEKIRYRVEPLRGAIIYNIKKTGTPDWVLNYIDGIGQ